jgi:N-formylmaleamate deformylase
MKALTLKLATLTLALGSALMPLPSVAAVQPNQAATAEQSCHCFDVQVSGEGPALLLIPGVASSADVWQATVAALQDRYQLHVLTLAGFAGVAPIPMQSWGEGYLQLQQQAILRYIREQRLDKPVIIGHSLGGYLALALAANAPEQIGAAINVDGLPALGALMAQNRAADDGKARPQTGFDPMAMAQQMAGSKEWQQQIVKDMYRSDGQTAGRVMGELMRADLRDQLQHIAVPVLTLGALQHGAPYSTPEQVQKNYEAQLANAPKQYHRFAFARDAKHFIMADAPDWLQRQIEQFLTELK